MPLATRIAVIIGDMLVLIVTWSKTAQLYRESQRLGIKAPLATLLLRDGECELVLVLPFHKLNHVFRDVLLCVGLLHIFTETISP